jgi:hypothetical protein
MKSRRNKKSRKNKRGGGLFGNKTNYTASLGDCDPNNLTSIIGSKALHENYQKCCPKGFMGTKNSSPYCKQLDLNFQAARKGENDANEYHGFDPDEVYQMKQQESTINTQSRKKPWYKFWGGKKTKRHIRRKTRTRRK